MRKTAALLLSTTALLAPAAAWASGNTLTMVNPTYTTTSPVVLNGGQGEGAMAAMALQNGLGIAFEGDVGNLPTTAPTAVKVAFGLDSGGFWIGENTDGTAEASVGSTKITTSYALNDGATHWLAISGSNQSYTLYAATPGQPYVAIGTGTSTSTGASAAANNEVGQLNKGAGYTWPTGATVSNVVIWNYPRYQGTGTAPSGSYDGTTAGIQADYPLAGNGNDVGAAAAVTAVGLSINNLSGSVTTGSTFSISGGYAGAAPTASTVQCSFTNTSTGTASAYVAPSSLTTSYGAYTASLTAPAVGTYTLSCQETGNTAASGTATTASFQSVASTSTSSSAGWDASIIQAAPPAGAPMQIGGDYSANYVPTGVLYAFDSGATFATATNFQINTAAMTWSATVPTPAAGSHTVTVEQSNATTITATSNSFTSVAAAFLAPNSAAFVYSPYNWSTPTAAIATTINAGAYFRTMFTGTSCTINMLIDGMKLPFSEVSVRVDADDTDTPYTEYSTQPQIPCSPSAATSAQPYHLLEFRVKATSTAVNAWLATPQSRVSFTGLTLASGKTYATPKKLTKKLLMFGDSITGGVATMNNTAAADPDQDDVAGGWAYNVAKSMNAEFGIVGFGGSGLQKAGSAGIPNLQTSYSLVYPGVARTLNATTCPDYIVMNEGTNDVIGTYTSATETTAAVAVLTNLTTACPSALTIVMEPFNASQAAALQAAVTQMASSQVFYLDTTGFLTTSYGIDTVLGLHPTSSNDVGMILPQVISGIEAIRTTYRATQRFTFQ